MRENPPIAQPFHCLHNNKIPAADFPSSRFPGVLLFSEIYQVTGPVARFARQIAGQGYIVAAPSSYHDFTGPEPLAYDVPGTDQGNEWKVKKVCYVFLLRAHTEGLCLLMRIWS